MNYFRHFFTSCLLLSSFGTLCNAQLSIPRERLTFYVKSSSGNSLTVLPNNLDNIEIRTKKIAVNKLDRIEFLLLREKFEPNLELYQLLYLLNPDLTRLDSLYDKQELILPMIHSAKVQLKTSERILVRLDESLKKAIVNKASLVLNAASSSDTLTIKEQLRTPEAFADFKNATLQLDKLTSAIREQTSSLTYEQLADIENECDILLSLTKEKQVTDSVDLNIMNRNFNEWGKTVFEQKSFGRLPKNNLAPVFASVIKIVDNKKVHIAGYTIYYRSPGLKDKKGYPFNQASSNTGSVKTYLAECTWTFWAQSNDSNPSATESKTVPIRINSDNTIELTLLKQ